jgi:hypothetical protein
MLCSHIRGCSTHKSLLNAYLGGTYESGVPALIGGYFFRSMMALVIAMLPV